MVTQKLGLSNSEMEERAKEMTFAALDAYQPPSDEEKSRITLGKMFTDEVGVFELYVAGERSEDAVVISRAEVNRKTGEVLVEVFLPLK